MSETSNKRNKDYTRWWKNWFMW